MEVGKDSDIRSTTVSSKAIGWMVSSSVAGAETPRPSALQAEPVREPALSQRCDLPYRAQAQSAHLGLHLWKGWG